MSLLYFTFCTKRQDGSTYPPLHRTCEILAGKLSWCFPLHRTCQQQTWTHNSSLGQHLKTPLSSVNTAVVDCLSWMSMSSYSANPSWPQSKPHLGIQPHLQPVVRHLSPHPAPFTGSPQLQEKKKSSYKTLGLVLLCPAWRSRVCFSSCLEAVSCYWCMAWESLPS